MSGKSAFPKPAPRRTALALGVLLLAGLAAFLLWPAGAPAERAMSATEAHEAAQAGDIILLDIREPEEWRESGIAEGAVPLDMRHESFGPRLMQLTDGDRETPVALICATGGRSAWLAQRLEDAGFTNVIDVSEGMFGSRAGPGWLRSGLPVRPYPDG
ncbi:rhodanese-like domain-containing protein [Roseovarius aestuariivivens]|uniref:rhodanese-like domain-containing protein n=1 Tax=Roseovarius aestuariivivens TaxID=1888910 RepID=UPI001FDA2047|nr:rhodanese-like domain-containing protein [Roseovarius aestuariivivens]